MLVLCLLAWQTLAVRGPAHAQPALRALDAAWLTPRLLPPRDQLLLAASAGYGFTEPVANVAGVHQRAAGSLALGVSSRLGLAAELRVDGRWDVHRHDDSLVGDPRLFFRFARAVHERMRAGVELGVWAPGGNAPSLDVRAISVDVLLLVEARLSAWATLSAALGPRFDQSAHSVDRSLVLSTADQLSLGVSDSHALLSRVAANVRLASYTVSAELSSDCLLGSMAPRVADSPWRAALLARRPLDGAGRIELTAALSALLSGRPALRTDRYWPFEPRFSLFVGLRYLLEHAAPARPVSATPAAPAAAPEPVARAAKTGVLLVVVHDDRGQPLPDMAVQLDALEQHTGDAGSARFDDVPVGERELTVIGAGFATQTMRIAIAQGVASEQHVSVTATHGESALRAQVRDGHSGAPLVARVRLTPVRGKGQTYSFETAADGSFELSIAPGRYRVVVQAPRHHVQTRALEVRGQDVTLFNFDLTPRRAR